MEDWTRILLEHPAKGWTSEKLEKKERDAKHCENMVRWIEEDEKKFKEKIKESGFTGINFGHLHPHIPTNIYMEAENEFADLTKNPETTVEQLTSIVLSVFQKGAEYYRKYATEYREMLNKIKEGVFVPEPEQEEW